MRVNWFCDACGWGGMVTMKADEGAWEGLELVRASHRRKNARDATGAPCPDPGALAVMVAEAQEDGVYDSDEQPQAPAADVYEWRVFGEGAIQTGPHAVTATGDVVRAAVLVDKHNEAVATLRATVAALTADIEAQHRTRRQTEAAFNRMAEQVAALTARAELAEAELRRDRSLKPEST